jgi:high-affinity Fe2+/Pb2+ permease
MYIGIGTVVLIVIIVLVFLMLRRLCRGHLFWICHVKSHTACTAAPGQGLTEAEAT